MKLSEAIRLGAMLKPQGFGASFDGGKTCALGAALDACGELLNEDGYLFLREHFPVLTCKVRHPVHDNDDDVMDWVIEGLNDNHEWTRERIADWVETIEAQEEQLDAIPSGSLELAARPS